MKYTLIIFSIFVLKCGTPKTETVLNISEKNTYQNITLQNKYTIKTVNGNNVTTHCLFIEFNTKTKQVSGFAGCNNFFGNYKTDNETIKLGPLATTRKMCAPHKNTLEKNILRALQGANKITVKNDSLILFNNTETILEAVVNNVKPSINFEYTQTSRGYFKQIKIDNNFAKISTTREAEGEKKRYTKSKWETLKNLIDSIDLKTLDTLQPPSKKHQFDGAALAKLTITLNGETYETQPFDHENPHPKIAKVVKEILSIAQNIE
ncbi:META domain-containing protein [Seonamhaeicola algicola]|uniref:META domain-containing protein n=1 Tax=Seonamhaeicola algicola TaxID=1719036 RepID=A0A5C7AWZ1_9FLAO|nr:META domain-containing protein [Seonamhaeicola algicola]TXE13198.1 META domain-containing protein [Seonamhaeicola algicola]